MIIRPADIDDATAIATIHVRSWQAAYKEILPEHGLESLSIEDRTAQWAGWLQAESSPTHTLVADDDEQVVGFASWGPSDDDTDAAGVAMLYSIYVQPNSTSKGVGSQLLEAIEVDMIAGGASEAVLNVLAENTPSRNFYERYGWQYVPESERVEEYFGMTMTTVRYRKSFS